MLQLVLYSGLLALGLSATLRNGSTPSDVLYGVGFDLLAGGVGALLLSTLVVLCLTLVAVVLDWRRRGCSFGREPGLGP